MFHWQKGVLYYSWQKITLATNEECIQSSVMLIETRRFFEEKETIIDTLNKTPTIHDDNSEEDLVH